MEGFKAYGVRPTLRYEWVSVKDMLPEPMQHIICFFAKKNNVQETTKVECYWDPKAIEGHDEKGYDFTHWLPLDMPEDPYSIRWFRESDERSKAMKWNSMDKDPENHEIVLIEYEKMNVFAKWTDEGYYYRWPDHKELDKKYITGWIRLPDRFAKFDL